MVLGGVAAVLATVLLAGSAAADGEVNVYSSRHYKYDDQLYQAFTDATGIKVNLIEGKGDELMQRMQAEGANSPADVFITVDAGMLWRAEQMGLFQPTESAVLTERIPENLRHPDGLWFGFTKRARVIFVDATQVDPALVQRYEDLARPELKGEICIRSSSNIYNLSLLGSLIDVGGAEAAEAWAKGVVANMAREPEGGDTDQLKAVAAGQCGVAVSNTYYFVRLVTSDDPADKAVAEKLTLVFPNQGDPSNPDRGTHVNVSGAGMAAHAPNQANAQALLEFLASDTAQGYFAHGNNEYPVVPGVEADAAVIALGTFKEDPINVAVLGQNQPEAQKIFDRAGWK
jgi:iron(III) transport system substrate-binding protein